MKEKIVAELVSTSWTILGMFVAWVVLEGEAKSVVGVSLLLVIAAWAVTMPMRLRD